MQVKECRVAESSLASRVLWLRYLISCKGEYFEQRQRRLRALWFQQQAWL